MGPRAPSPTDVASSPSRLWGGTEPLLPCCVHSPAGRSPPWGTTCPSRRSCLSVSQDVLSLEAVTQVQVGVTTAPHTGETCSLWPSDPLMPVGITRAQKGRPHPFLPLPVFCSPHSSVVRGCPPWEQALPVRTSHQSRGHCAHTDASACGNTRCCQK